MIERTRRGLKGAGRPGPAVAYGEPFAWWGPVWQTPPTRTVLDLLVDGTLPVAWAGAIWASLARRASIVVVAGPGGAGKTTVLSALLPFYPAETRRLYLRGCYEPFLFLADPRFVPERSLVLINEISAHLPIYLWGPGVGRALATIVDGCALAATAHAADAADLIGSLVGAPLRVAPAVVAGIDLVVVLGAGGEGGRSRVESLWLVGGAGGEAAAGRGVRLRLLTERRGGIPDISPLIEKQHTAKAEAAPEIEEPERVRERRLISGRSGRSGVPLGLRAQVREELRREVQERADFLAGLLDSTGGTGSVGGEELEARLAAFPAPATGWGGAPRRVADEERTGPE